MNRYILQDQKIPESKKTKLWDMSHVNNYLEYRGSVNQNDRREEQLKCWKYYHGYNDVEKQKNNAVVTKPYGFSLGIEYMHYPLISSIIEQVVGEWMTRPVKKKTYVMNKEGKAKKLDQMFAMVTESILREANEDPEIQEALGFVPETPNPEIELPEDIEDFIENGDFKTTSEEVSDLILEQVLEVKNNKAKLKDLLVDVLVQDEIIASIEKKDGHPSIKRENIFECDMDWNPEEEIQKDPQYFIKDKYLPFNEILNSYELSKEEEAILKSYSSLGRTSMVSSGDGYDDPKNRNEYWFTNSGDIMQIRCVEMFWISKRQLSAKVTINKKTNEEIYKLIPEGYNVKKIDNIKTIWVDYQRHILMVGPDLVLESGPVNERNSRIDDPKKDILNVVGLKRNNFMNAPMQSAAKKLLQLQDFASELLFELRLAMRRNMGKVLVYDSAQIPKQFLKSGGYDSAVNRVMHHAKKDQFLIINSQDRNARYAFNQFTSLDLSSHGMMNDIIATLALVEQLGAKFVGVSQERGGTVDQYQSATGTERAVAQSTARTEVYINPFENFIEEVLMKVLMKAKHVYEENEVVPYILGDLKTKFLQVYPAFFQDDIGVSIASNFTDQKKKQIIDSAAQQAFSSAQTPELILELIKILNSDTASESERILRRGIKQLAKLRDENNKAMQAAEQTRAESMAAETDKEHNLKREGYQKDVIVAQIQADNKSIIATSDRINQNRIKLAELENDALKAKPQG